MKKLFISAVVSIVALVPLAGVADTVESSFDGASGKIVLPNLIVGDQVFYLELNLVDAASLTFQANLTSASDITPTEATEGTVQSDLHGTWTIEDIGGTSNLRLVFNADGSYTHFQNTDAGTEEACVGDEVGTYAWRPATGFIAFSLTSDTNGDCGMSDPRGSFLFFVDGNTLTISETGDRGESFLLTRVN